MFDEFPKNGIDNFFTEIHCRCERLSSWLVTFFIIDSRGSFTQQSIKLTTVYGYTCGYKEGSWGHCELSHVIKMCNQKTSRSIHNLLHQMAPSWINFRALKDSSSNRLRINSLAVVRTQKEFYSELDDITLRFPFLKIMKCSLVVSVKWLKKKERMEVKLNRCKWTTFCRWRDWWQKKILTTIS